MAQKTYQIGEITGYGWTKTEARAAAEEKAAHMSRNVAAAPVAFGGPDLSAKDCPFVCLVAPGAENSWAYYWLESDRNKPRLICGGFETQSLASYAALEHWIGLLVGADTSTADLYVLEKWLAGVLGDPGQAITLRVGAAGRVAWLRRYRAATQAGAGPNQAHRHACEGG